jgi:hypothetical protein
MKKLALALMCLVSVAFFASCTKPVENPEPAISVISDEGFVQNDAVVDLGSPIIYGFKMTANTETKKDLSKLSITTTITDLEGKEESTEEIITISGQEYSYTDTISFVAKETIGYVKFTATVTDVDGKVNTATLNLTINKPAQPLIGRAITWVRSGQNVESATETELANMGLRWTGSYRDIMATIRPLENADVTLYLCPGDDYDKITTDVEKAAYFANLSENPDAQAIDKYRNISAEQTHNYNDLLAVVYNGGSYLIHITHAKVDNMGSAGTKITITGETK